MVCSGTEVLQPKSCRSRFFDDEGLVHAVKRFRDRIARPFLGRMVNDTVTAAPFKRAKDSLVHGTAHFRGNFMVVQMKQHEIERAILRQR